MLVEVVELSKHERMEVSDARIILYSGSVYLCLGNITGRDLIRWESNSVNGLFGGRSSVVNWVSSASRKTLIEEANVFSRQHGVLTVYKAPFSSRPEEQVPRMKMQWKLRRAFAMCGRESIMQTQGQTTWSKMDPQMNHRRVRGLGNMLQVATFCCVGVLDRQNTLTLIAKTSLKTNTWLTCKRIESHIESLGK